ncbi:zinc finger protein 808-like [Drosophila eugracilis]|uniref:zinc finger protein 808-like n=1 Tax=Drosophila eugracilis TaxID=29029 RepID=UPI0007E68095|nr:zinc finger protein 808-like [Drosophila eugracilis]
MVNKTTWTQTTCRICWFSFSTMINIFDGPSEVGFSNVDVISHYTGKEVKRGDAFPETVCSLCMVDARIAFRARLSCEESNQCEIKPKEEDIGEVFEISEFFDEDIEEETFKGQIIEEGFEEGACILPDCDMEESKIDEEIPVKNEKIGEEEYSLDGTQSMHVQIKNEPIEEEEYQVSSNCDVTNEPIKTEILDDGALTSPIEQCNEETKTNLLESHMQTHKKGWFKCSICPKTFSLKNSLIRHRKMHEGGPLNCSECSMTFNNRSQFSQHMRTHSFTCLICSESFAVNSDLKQHMQTHNDFLFKEPIKKELDDGAHTRLMVQSDLKKCTRAINKTSLQCSHCRMLFSTQTFLETHMQTHEERPYKCQLCPKSFVLQKHLSMHGRVHEGGPFKCSECSMPFVTRRELMSHMHQHVLRCLMCFKIFKSSSDLDVHMRDHHVERFNCSICSESFSFNNDLKRHMRTHNDSLLKCTLCPKLFKDKYALKNHLRSHKDQILPN